MAFLKQRRNTPHYLPPADDTNNEANIAGLNCVVFHRLYRDIIACIPTSIAGTKLCTSADLEIRYAIYAALRDGLENIPTSHLTRHDDALEMVRLALDNQRRSITRAAVIEGRALPFPGVNYER